MVFLGQPSEVAKALRTMVYMSAEPYVEDVVTVQVWDGAALGTGCLPASDFKTASSRPKCCAAGRALRVAVGDYAGAASMAEDAALPPAAYASLLLAPILAYVLAYKGKLRWRRWRRLRSDPAFAARVARRRAQERARFRATLLGRCWAGFVLAVLGCAGHAGAAAACTKAGAQEGEEGEEEGLELGDLSTMRQSLAAAAAAAAPGGLNGAGEEVSLDDDALFEDDELPCVASAARFEALRRLPRYASLAQQEDAVAGQLAGGHEGLRRLLEATEGSEGDAGSWAVQYLASGAPLYVHAATGFRTFDRPRALQGGRGAAEGGEEAHRPVSTLAALPVESDWYEHRVQDLPDGLVFYRHLASGLVSWEDPYECTLAAAAEASGEDGEAAALLGAAHVLEDSWERLFSAPEAFGDRKVFWRNAQTGQCQWEEPGTEHIRRAIRDAEREARALRAAEAEERAAGKAAALAAVRLGGLGGPQGTGSAGKKGGKKRGSFFFGSGGSSGGGEGGGIVGKRKSFFFGLMGSKSGAEESEADVDDEDFPLRRIKETPYKKRFKVQNMETMEDHGNYL